MADASVRHDFVKDLVRRCCANSLLDAKAEDHDRETDTAIGKRSPGEPIWSSPRHVWHKLYVKERSTRLATIPVKTNFRKERARVSKERRH